MRGRADPVRGREPDGLSPRLRALVKEVQATLGAVVRAREGEPAFAAIEAVRQSMVAFRDARGRAAETRALERARAVLEALTPAAQVAVARAYTLYLELVNACENAYRTHRLRARGREVAATVAEAPAPGRPGKRASARASAAPATPAPPAVGAARANVVWVLTAHPTESRSPANIRVLRRVQGLLAEALDDGRAPADDALVHLLHQAWTVGTHPRHRPSVEDEARHIFSLLTDEILGELVALRREGHRVRLRTWVGGDKDGHPGVGPAQTLASLGLSRARLIGYASRLAAEAADDAALLGHPGLELAARALVGGLGGLVEVRDGDGGRVEAFARAARGLERRYRVVAGADHPGLARLQALLGLFPALVVPLELREERGQFRPASAIAAMLEALREVAAGGRIDGYVRGVVVSMAETAADLVEAARLVAEVLGDEPIPVIPLFELPEVLARAVEIVDGAWADEGFRATARREGRPLFEVMLGYSDTAKRMGVLASRVAIHDAIRAIGAWGRERGVELVYFHGSGGSVGRGGGSFEEQAATWPAEAVGTIKQTIQGEMVERTLATPEILRRQVEQIAGVQASPPRYAGPSRLTRQLARAEERGFQALVAEPSFLELLAAATPYERLGLLTIGSRPARRASAAAGEAPPSLERLRAIPWVLCWTQTRFLLHAWAGIGSAWREAEAAGATSVGLRAALAKDPLLRSHLRQLGFTLAKAAPRLFEEYARRLAPDAPRPLLARLAAELESARALAAAATPDGDLLPDRAWLIESIYYRAPMIHPLNLIQIELLERARWSPREQMLFRETVTGIAAGMLTTG